EEVQATAEEMGLTPLYFASYPILADDEMANRLAAWAHAGRANVGLHLHSWSTPPLSGEEQGSQSFQCQLNKDVHKQKLSTLARLFESRLGLPPIAHRAGRYGIAPWVLDQLAEIGVTYDFSPSPGFDFSSQGGPDFSNTSPLPHRRHTHHGSMWVLPVSGSRAIKRTRIFVPPQSRMVPKMLRSVGVRLSPEGNDLATMQRLTHHLIKRGTPLLTPSFHLSSLVPGTTPYAQSEEEAFRLLDRLRQWWSWVQSDAKVSATHLSGLTHSLDENSSQKADQSSR
ncbi:MAG: hypothetical protein AAF986_01070, partial [Pseudomonadota bacterium]